MKIDIEQFLAMTVALGCAGAVGFAVYSGGAEVDDIIVGVQAAQDPAEASETPTAAAEVAAAVVAPGPMPAEPADLDDAAGIPAVVPDDPSAYAPGPDSEMSQWD